MITLWTLTYQKQRQRKFLSMKNLINKDEIRKPRNAATDILIRYPRSRKIRYKQNSSLLLKKKISNIRDK